MENYYLAVIAFILGIVLAYFWGKISFSKLLQATIDTAQFKLADIEKELITLKATSLAESASNSNTILRLQENIISQTAQIKEHELEIASYNSELATYKANYASSVLSVQNKIKEVDSLKDEIATLKKEAESNNIKFATEVAEKKSLNEKLQTQMKEMEELNKKFTTEFENIANKIFDTKTQKLTDLNKENIKVILEPLGKNIEDFKKQVDDAYKAESNERFSLGKEVKKLSELNQLLGEEAKNLTKALKGESKTQGRWGEVILETILDKSGLRKGEEYFMEYQLFDKDGKALRSEAEGKKMRPDALVMYPDNRHIIIDAKVSLNAFIRFTEATDTELQKTELQDHVNAVKAHINELSKKAYDDYDKTLDFVMMFIPNEPAYIAAMQGEVDLWNYAYDRRILLISPTNLIASLKLMVDLWKREYQNQNAQKIADRGAKLYEKIVGFINNMESIGGFLDRAQDKYNEAYKQLTAGNGNMVSQATQLKELGLKSKAEFKAGLSEIAKQSDNEIEN